MKRNWLKTVAIVASLVAGTIGNSALAGNKGGPSSGGSSFHPQVGTSLQGAVTRSIGNTQTFQPQIKTLNGNDLSGIQGIKLQDRQHSPILNVPQLSNGVQGIQLKNTLDLTKKINGIGGNQPLPFNQDLAKKIGNVVDPKLHINPDLAHKINGAILDKKCLPGCFPGCKPGCFPWWWSPFWGSCYSSCYPCYYYPTYYVEPIVIPVTTVAADSVAPVAGVVEDKLMQVPVGATLTLQASNLGDKAGQVILQIDKISLPAQVSEWKNDSVTATLPMIGLNGNVKAEIMLVKPDGSLGSSVKVELIPAQLPTQSSDAATAAR